MGVSERDRAFMARVAGYKAASHAEAQEQHRALPLEKRLQRSWELYLAGRGTQKDRERGDDPSPFYARARARGLCS